MVLLLAIQDVPAGETLETPEHEPRAVEGDPAKAAADALAAGGEIVRMRWRLSGFVGFFAGLFLPGSGDALLAFVPVEGDRMEIRLLVTAPKRKGEYYFYGAQIDETSGSTEEVWSSQVFRGERKDWQRIVEAANMIDYASAIYDLRWHPPDASKQMTIWDDGDTYSARIDPLGPRRRKISGKKMDVRGYLVRGAEIEGEKSFESKMYLYFATDDKSTPAEIVGKRGIVSARIQLLEIEGKPRPPGRESRHADARQTDEQGR